MEQERMRQFSGYKFRYTLAICLAFAHLVVGCSQQESSTERDSVELSKVDDEPGARRLLSLLLRKEGGKIKILDAGCIALATCEYSDITRKEILFWVKYEDAGVFHWAVVPLWRDLGEWAPHDLENGRIAWYRSNEMIRNHDIYRWLYGENYEAVQNFKLRYDSLTESGEIRVEMWKSCIGEAPSKFFPGETERGERVSGKAPG